MYSTNSTRGRDNNNEVDLLFLHKKHSRSSTVTMPTIKLEVGLLYIPELGLLCIHEVGLIYIPEVGLLSSPD